MGTLYFSPTAGIKISLMNGNELLLLLFKIIIELKANSNELLFQYGGKKQKF